MASVLSDEKGKAGLPKVSGFSKEPAIYSMQGRALINSF
jgi:hypothetical protein